MKQPTKKAGEWVKGFWVSADELNKPKKYPISNPKGTNQHTKVEIMPKQLTIEEKAIKGKEMYLTWLKASNEAKSYIQKALFARKKYDEHIKEMIGVKEE